MPSDKMSEQTCFAMCRIIWSSIMPCRSVFERPVSALCVSHRNIILQKLKIQDRSATPAG